jgi:hypothetical protein
MLSSNMLLPNLIPLIDVTFSTPTPVNVNQQFGHRAKRITSDSEISILFVSLTGLS